MLMNTKRVQGLGCSYTRQPQYSSKTSRQNPVYTRYNLSYIQKGWCNSVEDDSETQLR